MTLVSVVIAARNAERWIAQAVTSVLVQTHRELELIVVDDASTDRTADVVAAFRDSRVRLIRQEHNRGCGHACNVALAVARGELVARLDADDWALSHRLERQVAALAAAPDVGVLDSSMWVVDLDGRVQGMTRQFTGRALHYQLVLDCPIMNPGVMMRRAVLPVDGYPAVETRMEDYALWLTLAPTTRLEHLAEPLGFYRRHPSASGYQRAGVHGPRVWAGLVGPQVGLVVAPHVAAAWLDPRKLDGVSESQVAELVMLAERLAPDTFPIGPHVPPWEPRARARARRLYAYRLVALVRAARERGRRDVVRALRRPSIVALARAFV